MTGRNVIAGALLLRACINGAFVGWLLAYSPGWTDVFQGGAVYAIADGVIGLLLFLQLGWFAPIGAPPALVAVILIDALLRLGGGAAILAFPGIPETPITVVLFYGILGAWAASVGTITIVVSVAAHRHGRPGVRPFSTLHAMFDPLSWEAIIALLLAVYALAVGPPAIADELRVAGAVAAGSFALVLLIAAWGVARPHRPAPGT